MTSFKGSGKGRIVGVDVEEGRQGLCRVTLDGIRRVVKVFPANTVHDPDDVAR